jgi:hypothetical protein
MYVIVWRFLTNAPAEFERHYGPAGTWVQLFRRSSDFVRTDLLRSNEGYLTLDWWASRASYDAFRGEHAAEYGEIDVLCESITTFEEKIGEYEESLPPPDGGEREHVSD